MREDVPLRGSASSSTIKPVVGDLKWAAGFLEGEGCFLSSHKKRNYGTVSAKQVQRQPLEGLKAMFGGSIYFEPRMGNASNIHRWQITGARARGVMLTLYGLLSPVRRGQIRRALYG